MKERTYILPGNPIPLARPRLGHRKVWDSQKNLKLLFGIELQNQHQGDMMEGSLLLDITFYIQIPISWSDKRRESYIGRYHSSKPDTSNLIKFVEDVATGIIYNDDAQISKIIAQKVYALESSTSFTLRQI